MKIVTTHIGKYQTGSGSRYRVRITNRRLIQYAHRFNKAGFNTRRAATEYARAIERKIERLERSDVELSSTLGNLIMRYQQEALPFLNPVDQRRRKQQLSWWANYFGKDTALVDITPRKISEGLAALSQKRKEHAPRGKPQKAHESKLISPATVNRYRAALSALFSFGVKDVHWIDRNPVHDTRCATEPRGRIRWLEPNELDRLGQYVDEETGHLPLLFWLALTTGARRGELLAAQWANVKFEHGYATVTLPTTKNKEPRVLPIALPKVVNLLRAQKVRIGHTSELVFPPERAGERHYRWRISFNNALEKADIQNFRFHDLRHCFASYLAMQGHDTIQIADLLGQKSLSMAQRYSHLNPKARMRNARSAIAGMGLIDKTSGG